MINATDKKGKANRKRLTRAAISAMESLAKDLAQTGIGEGGGSRFLPRIRSFRASRALDRARVELADTVQDRLLDVMFSAFVWLACI